MPKIMIDQKPFDWEKDTITGSEIKALAGVDPSYGVWLQQPGPEDPTVADSESIDLTQPGRERFFTGKKETTEG
mgnify:CR=1 FL=1